MAASVVTTVDDRVQTVLTSAGITAAVNNHATLIDTSTASQVLHATLAVTPANFTAGAGAKTLTVVTPALASGSIVLDTWFELSEVFAGGALSAVTCQLGRSVGPNTDAFTVATDVFTGATLGAHGFVTAELGVDHVPATRQPLLEASESVTATFTPTGAAMSVATTGTMTVHVLYRIL